MSLRQVVKRAGERLLRFTRGRPDRMAGRGLILAYHNVVPDAQPPAGDRPLHLALSAFARQLDLLQEHCDVVSLSAILQHRSSARPRVALTFDDAYQGAMTLALPELARRQLPVTVFLAPGCFGASGFWWDQLAGERGLAPEIRDQALERHQGRQDLVAPTTDRVLPLSHQCAGEALVRQAAGPGVTYGAHSWSHPNLARLDSGMLQTELVKPLEWLQQSGMPMISMLAYPYGLATPAVREATRRAGYEAALEVEGGWLAPAPADPFALPRYNVPAGLSEDGLMLRLAGVIPA